MRKENATNAINATNSTNNRPKTTSSRTFMTIEEVCADLGISRSTYYDWRAKKKSPPSIKLPNGDLRIRRTDYDTWLETLAEAAA